MLPLYRSCKYLMLALYKEALNGTSISGFPQSGVTSNDASPEMIINVIKYTIMVDYISLEKSVNSIFTCELTPIWSSIYI